MEKSKIAGITVVVFFLAALLGYASWQALTQPSLGEGEILGASNAPVDSSFNITTNAYSSNGTQDVVGTRLGSTSTVGVAVGIAPNVTTSYVSKIGNDKRIATYQIRVTSVTGTDNNLSFTVQGSNDYLCETRAGSASSTTDVVQANINWYDAMVNLKGRVYPTSLTNNSSTAIYDFNDVVGNNAWTVILTDLNFTCLRLRVSGSSTLIYAGLNTGK